MKIPFVDLESQYQTIKAEIFVAIESVMDSKQFIQGAECEKFAQNFLAVHGGNYGIGCSNGTSAITLALKALGIGPGDEVITAVNTFFATIEAIVAVGATPVFVDCLPRTYGIDLFKIEQAITGRTKGIIPVHLYGNPVSMDELVEMANQYNLKIIEDCAQAHLATFKGRAVGTFGDAGTFSFYPGKNMGAYGDAGFVITKDDELRSLISMHLNHGRSKKYEHDFFAGNDRMDGIQGAILSVKAKYIEGWTHKRISAAKYYDHLLADRCPEVMKVQEEGKCVYHLYVVEVSNRDEVVKYLQDHDISCGIHYPIPMHLQPACGALGYSLGDFPVAEKAATKTLSLPIFPEISKAQQDYIIKKTLEVAQ